MNDLIGRQIGSYRIEATLGRGGMAFVYLAFDTGVDRRVALKVLPPHFGSDPDFVQRFLHEARSTVDLRHPNIVRTYTAGEKDGFHYIAMEYMDGGSLERRIDAGTALDPGEVVRIVADVAAALDHAHNRQVIHRDLKPFNILFNAAGTAKLADFGIAKSRHQLTVTVPSMLIGTPSYMSPEQAEGKPVSASTDIWSLGVVTYQMLTGVLPFAADTAPATLFQVVHSTPTPPSRRTPGLPGTVDKVLARAMAKAPGARYTSAAEFTQSLAAALDAPIGIRPPASQAGRKTPTPVPTTPQPGPRRPAGPGRILAVGGLMGVALLGAGLTARWLMGSIGSGSGGGRGAAPVMSPDRPPPMVTDSPPSTSVSLMVVETDTPPAVTPISESTTLPTEPPTPLATPRPTLSPVPPAPVENAAAVALMEPVDGASFSGAVRFMFAGDLDPGLGEVFDVRVCKGERCQPQFGVTNTTEKLVSWSPSEGAGIYRWQVVIIDNASKQARGRASPVWQFTIADSGGQGADGRAGDDDDNNPGPAPVSTPR